MVLLSIVLRCIVWYLMYPIPLPAIALLASVRGLCLARCLYFILSSMCRNGSEIHFFASAILCTYPIFQLNHSAMVDCNATSMTLTGFRHSQNSPFVLIARASDDTPGYVSKLQQVNETNLTSNLQDPFSQPCSQESHRFSDLPLLSHSAYLRKVVFFTKFWRRRIEDLPNSAIFKLSCRSKHFGFFGKWRLKDTELKCLWSNF